MAPHLPERGALAWWLVSTGLFLVALALAPRSSAPLNWLLPLSTGLTAMTWFLIWRHRRRSNDGTLR